MTGELTGLVAGVTGGGSGIGLATARLLAERGARVAVLDLAPGEEFLSLTLAMAADHIAEGIRVNCVNPGTTDTPWIGRLLDQAGDPAEASVTGTALAIDGGMAGLRLRPRS